MGITSPVLMITDQQLSYYWFQMFCLFGYIIVSYQLYVCHM